MNLDTYPVTSSTDLLTHSFVSEGPKGEITKHIYFQPSGLNSYNLAFGDWIIENKQLDDTARSNNKDRDKVLATVAKTIVMFLQKFPSSRIEVKGSTNARTRLYQIKIIQYLSEVQQNYIIQGCKDNEWEFFDPTKDYNIFSLTTKNHEI